MSNTNYEKQLIEEATLQLKDADKNVDQLIDEYSKKSRILSSEMRKYYVKRQAYLVKG